MKESASPGRESRRKKGQNVNSRTVRGKRGWPLSLAWAAALVGTTVVLSAAVNPLFGDPSTGTGWRLWHLHYLLCCPSPFGGGGCNGDIATLGNRQPPCLSAKPRAGATVGGAMVVAIRPGRRTPTGGRSLPRPSRMQYCRVFASTTDLLEGHPTRFLGIRPRSFPSVGPAGGRPPC